MTGKRALLYLISVLLAAMCISVYGFTMICFRNLIFLGALLYLSVMDLKSCIIPDKALLIALLAWFGAIPFAYEVYGGMFGICCSVLAAMLFAGGILFFILMMDRLLQKETMGGGDIKLLAVMGLYLGMPASLFALFLACVLGLCFALLCIGNGKSQIPFGPSISIAGWLMLLYGEPIMAWYMKLVL
ncbi:MAG: prepilin peptidase [Peptococcaceae bacterium]|nr:prepilin peptidase [Peptococcaceae bacterium]